MVGISLTEYKDRTVEQLLCQTDDFGDRGVRKCYILCTWCVTRRLISTPKIRVSFCCTHLYFVKRVTKSLGCL